MSGMIWRGISTWRRLAALAPLLLLVVMVPGQSMLRCRVDGLLRAACCCPHDAEAAAGGPALKAADCCDRETTAHEPPAAEAARSSAAEMTVMAVSASSQAPHVVAAPSELTSDARARRTQGPPREGPRIVLLKSAFLI